MSATLAALLLSACELPERRTVTSVIDGETFVLSDGATVRMLHVDAPSEGQCGFEEARDALSAMILGKALDLETPSSIYHVPASDAAGNLLRLVTLPEAPPGQDEPGVTLIEQGLAQASDTDTDDPGYTNYAYSYEYAARDVETLCARQQRLADERAEAVLENSASELSSREERESRLASGVEPNVAGSEYERGLPVEVEGGVEVAYAIDGDTLVLESGERVRLIGVDTPERGECGYAEATEHLAALVDGQTVTLHNPGSRAYVDRYARLLRYVEVDGIDVGRSALEAGLAVARYDGLDGYPWHPRQSDYRALDERTAHLCGESAENQVIVAVPVPAVPDGGVIVAPVPAPAPAPQPATGNSGQDEGYTGCRAYAPGGKTWKPIPCN